MSALFFTTPFSSSATSQSGASGSVPARPSVTRISQVRFGFSSSIELMPLEFSNRTEKMINQMRLGSPIVTIQTTLSLDETDGVPLCLSRRGLGGAQLALKVLDNVLSVSTAFLAIERRIAYLSGNPIKFAGQFVVRLINRPVNVAELIERLTKTIDATKVDRILERVEITAKIHQ